MKKKRAPQWIRWIFSLAVLGIVFYLTENQEIQKIETGESPILYANVCQDDLEKVFINAIQEAKKSIFLVIYSLTDQKLIQALNTQAANGISISVIHDPKTPQFGFQKLSQKIDNQPIKRSGLMHQKILVIDEEKIWIGSANMTVESLKLHDNLVIGMINDHLARAILRKDPFFLLNLNGQQIEYWDLPSNGKEGLQRIIELLDNAQKTIRIAMFTWTHPALTAAVIRAHQRGIRVEIVHDSGQAGGVCIKTVDLLDQAGIDIHLSSGLGLLHHKFAWIDETYLINGSANWTSAAFLRNQDCFLILHPLTESQNEKMAKIWRRTFVSCIYRNPQSKVAA